MYASAGGNNKIRVYSFDNGRLDEKGEIPLNDSKNTNYYPAGLSVSSDGSYLYVANNLDHSVSKVDIQKKSVVKKTDVGKNPYTAYLSQDGRSLYISNWGESSVSVLDPETMEVKNTIKTGLHPNAITENPVSGDIYIANSDDDTISIIDPGSQRVIQTLSVKPYKKSPTGSQPDSLTVSKDGKTLYVANAGNNDVAVVDLSGQAARVKGLIPTAWYPTGVYLDNQQQDLMVTNAKGLGAGPNSDGQYIGNMMEGTLSVLDIPNDNALKQYTHQAKKNNPIEQTSSKESKGQNEAPVPRNISQQSPIKHVIYVIRKQDV